MKKKGLIIVAMVIIIIAIIAFATSNNSNNKKVVEGVDFSSTTGMEEFINKVYEPLGDKLPNLMTMVTDVNDTDALKYNTGLSSNQGIEAVVVSEPMMNAQAYSLVLVKVAEDADVQSVKKEIFDNIDTRKWICAEAENKYATDYGNTVIFLMAAKEWAEPVYGSIKNILGDAAGEELKAENEMNSNQMMDGQMEAYPGDEEMVNITVE